jgi:TolB protein
LSKRILAVTTFLLAAAGSIFTQADTSKPTTPTIFPGETHFKNIRQLTFGGQNAEAYWSGDGTMLSLQSSRDGHDCDAIYTMKADGSGLHQVSDGRGTTTCSMIQPGNKFIIYASTTLVDSTCPPKPDFSKGYVWALYKGYDIFKANIDGSNPVRLTNTDGYDAECVFSPDGTRILFTSVRSGDLELWVMNADGSNPEQLTHEVGYDGGGWFSADGQSIVWRASRPQGAELKEYTELLAQGLVRPHALEIYTMTLKDRKPIQLTSNGAANFAPYFHPDGKHIIYCSNSGDPKGRNFDLYLIDIATKKIEQITFNDTFDGFPMWTMDGKKFVFASNRNGKIPHETNVFVADWVW